MNSFDDSILTSGNLGQQTVPRFVQVVRTAALVSVGAVPLVVAPWAHDAFSQPKVLVVYALAGVMVVGWIAAYISGYRRWRTTVPETAVWLFLLALLVSSWVSVNARLTFFGPPGRHEGLLTLVAYLIFYFVGVHFLGSARGVLTVFRVGAVVGAIAIGYGIIQVFLPPLFAAEAAIKTSYASLGYPRSSSTLGSPVDFGAYLALMTPVLLTTAISARGSSRVLWSIAAGLGYVATLMTFTRGVWLAVAVSTGILAIAIGREIFQRYWKTFGTVLAVMVIGLVLTVMIATPRQVVDRISSTFVVRSGSVGERMYIWDRTIDLIRARPLLGWGLATLVDIFPYDHQELVKVFGFKTVIIDEAHNDLLQIAVSIGIPGALTYVSFWILVIVVALRTLRRTIGPGHVLAAGWLAALVAYLVQAQFSFSTVSVTPIVWLMAGAMGGWEAVDNGE